MAGEGVSKEAIYAAAERIRKDGASPTVRTVRKITGGSNERVASFLKEWKEAKSRASKKSLFADKLESVISELRLELIEEITNEVQTLITTDLNTLQRLGKQAEQESSEAQALKQVYKEQIEHERLQAAELLASLNTANEQIAVLKEKLSKTEARVNAEAQTITKLETDHKALTARHEQLMQDNDDLNKKLARQTQVATVQQEMAEDALLKLAEANNRADALSKTLDNQGLALSDATKDNQALQRELEKLTKTNTIITEKNAHLVSAQKHLRDEVAKLIELNRTLNEKYESLAQLDIESNKELADKVNKLLSRMEGGKSKKGAVTKGRRNE